MYTLYLRITLWQILNALNILISSAKIIQTFLKRCSALQFGPIFGNLKANYFLFFNFENITFSLTLPNAGEDSCITKQIRNLQFISVIFCILKVIFVWKTANGIEGKKRFWTKANKMCATLFWGISNVLFRQTEKKTRGEILLRIRSMVHVVMSPLFWSVCFCFSFVDFLLFFETKLLILEFLLVNLFMYMHTFFCFSVFLFLIRWFKSYRTSVRYIDDFWLWETHWKWERFIVRIFSYIIFEDSLSLFTLCAHQKSIFDNKNCYFG